MIQILSFYVCPILLQMHLSLPRSKQENIQLLMLINMHIYKQQLHIKDRLNFHVCFLSHGTITQIIACEAWVYSVFENLYHQKWTVLDHNQIWLLPKFPIFHWLTLLLHIYLSSYHKSFFLLSFFSNCFLFCIILLFSRHLIKNFTKAVQW